MVGSLSVIGAGLAPGRIGAAVVGRLFCDGTGDGKDVEGIALLLGKKLGASLAFEVGREDGAGLCDGPSDGIEVGWTLVLGNMLGLPEGALEGSSVGMLL